MFKSHSSVSLAEGEIFGGILPLMMQALNIVHSENAVWRPSGLGQWTGAL